MSILDIKGIEKIFLDALFDSNQKIYDVRRSPCIAKMNLWQILTRIFTGHY